MQGKFLLKKRTASLYRRNKYGCSESCPLKAYSHIAEHFQRQEWSLYGSPNKEVCSNFWTSAEKEASHYEKLYIKLEQNLNTVPESDSHVGDQINKCWRCTALNDQRVQQSGVNDNAAWDELKQGSTEKENNQRKKMGRI
jgi:hypothetical protein